MTFPHPQSRKHNCRKCDISNNGSIVWEFFKWTVNVADYRNSKDDVDRAKDRTFGSISHSIPFRREFAANIFQLSTPGLLIFWLQKNRGCILFVVPASVHQRPFSRQAIYPIDFEIPQEF